METILRCAICDHTNERNENMSNSVVFRQNNKTTVRWRPKHQEYQCEACFQDIKRSMLDYNFQRKVF